VRFRAFCSRRQVTAFVVTRLGLASSIIMLFSGCGSQLAVHASGNQLIDAHGRPLRLLGVSISGPEYACIQGLGIFAGPTNERAIEALASWRINAVRVPLNEQCWLGINGVPARYAGARYRAAIRAYVTRLHQAHLYAILDLHWSAPGKAKATGQQVMADLDHAPALWGSVARAFKDDPAVLFDLYNEPGAIGWKCWRDGCARAQGWRAAGMQTLLDAVRAVGARQPVIVTGPAFGTDLSSWLRYRPRDPASQSLAGIHVYDATKCVTVHCWDSQFEPVTRVVPLIATELGQRECSHSFIDRFMNWADSVGVSYLGWAWNPFGCRAPALINFWDGEPTPYGAGLRAHLIKLGSQGRERLQEHEDSSVTGHDERGTERWSASPS
jgi:endoglucanase